MNIMHTLDGATTWTWADIPMTARFVTCPDCAGKGYKVARNALSRKYEARECRSCEGSGKLEVKKP